MYSRLFLELYQILFEHIELYENENRYSQIIS